MAHQYMHGMSETTYNTVVMNSMVNQQKAKKRKELEAQQLRQQQAAQKAQQAQQAQAQQPQLYKVFTSLHPYYVIGPYPIPTKNMWYCDNKACQYTTHGTFGFYKVRNWRSQQFGTNYVLCDGCVKIYQIDLTNPQPQQPNVNVNVGMQNQYGQMQNNPNFNNNNMNMNPNLMQRSSANNMNNLGQQQQLLQKMGSASSINSQNSQRSSGTLTDAEMAQLSATNVQRTSSKRSSKMNAEIFKDANIVKRGWILKRGNIVKGWKRRWVVLKDDKQLYYYSNDITTSVKGVAQLYEVIHIIKTDKQIFSVETKSRTWHFSCATEADRDDWCEKLRKLLKAPIMIAKKKDNKK